MAAALACLWLAGVLGPAVIVVQLPWVVLCLLRSSGPAALAATLVAAALCLIDLHGAGSAVTLGGVHGWTAFALLLTPLACQRVIRRTLPGAAGRAQSGASEAPAEPVAAAISSPPADQQIAIDALPHALMAADARGLIVAVNAAWCSRFGAVKAQVEGCTILELFEPAAHASLAAVVSALAQRRPAPPPFDGQLLSGRTSAARVRIEAAFGPVPPGEAVGIWIGMLDVAELRARERELALAEARYRTLVEDQNDLVSLADAHGVLTFVNHAYARHFGHAPQAMIGTNLFDYIAEHDRTAVRRHLEMVIRSGRVITDQNRMLSADGILHWVEWTNRALPDASGLLTLIHSVGRDITERKQAEHAVRMLVQEQSAIINSELIGITKVRDRHYTWGNIGVCRMLGYTAEELVGMPTVLTYPDEQAYRALGAAAYPVIRSGGAYRGETVMRRKDGSEIWVDCTAVLFDREADETLWVFTDITVRKQAELTLRRSLALTEQQRLQLAEFREAAESEAALARFLLSRLARSAQLDAPGVAYHWAPAESFSGDLIAVATSGAGDRYGMLADATGHGLAAAINLIPLTSAFYDYAGKGFNLATISEQLNQVVKDYSLPDRFVAVTLVRFVARERQLEVANAGNPAALLVDGQQRLLREFGSATVPLGILDRQGYRPRVETHALRGDEQLLMFSDGVIEACDAAGTAFGRSGLDAALAQASAPGALLPAICAGLERHTAGRRQADDISLLLMHAPELPTHPAQRAFPDGREASADQEHDCWTVMIALSCEELKRVEVVPVIVDLTRTLGLGAQAAARFFTVLSELVVNSLEHGLLLMDSAIKAGPDGFDRYLELRDTRLQALRQGSIEVRLTHWALSEGGRLRIEVRDSGAGFDHRHKLGELAQAANAPGGTLPSGRGLPLLMTLCERLEFNDAGNGVTAEFSYH